MASGENKNEREGLLALHAVLEASILPWDVELHRADKEEDAGGGGSGNVAAQVPAAEYVWCLSEDSDCSKADIHNPAANGIGSYIDFVYRRFMDNRRSTNLMKLQYI